MKIILWINSLLFLPFCFSGQSLILEVTSSSGEYFSNQQNGSLHWTVGEPMCERYENGDVLTQGFQQFFMTVTPVFDISDDLLGIRLYPNPVNDMLTVECSGIQSLRLVLHDMYGKAIYLLKEENPKTEMDLSELPVGTYLLSCFSGSQLIMTHKIQRIAYK